MEYFLASVQATGRVAIMASAGTLRASHRRQAPSSTTLKSAKAAKYYSEGVPAVLANPGLGVQCLNLSFGVGAGQRTCVTVDLLGLCGACAPTHGKSPIPLPLTLPRARPG